MITAVFGDALLDPATGDSVKDAIVLIEDGRVTVNEEVAELHRRLGIKSMPEQVTLADADLAHESVSRRIAAGDREFAPARGAVAE